MTDAQINFFFESNSSPAVMLTVMAASNPIAIGIEIWIFFMKIMYPMEMMYKVHVHIRK